MEASLTVGGGVQSYSAGMVGWKPVLQWRVEASLTVGLGGWVEASFIVGGGGNQSYSRGWKPVLQWEVEASLTVCVLGGEVSLTVRDGIKAGPDFIS